MKRVVLPLEESARRSAQPGIQPSSLSLLPLNQEKSPVQPAELALERPNPERTPILVAEPEIETAVVESEIEPQSTTMPQPTTATASQEFPATPVTTQTLLLLTSAPIYDRTATLAASEHPQSPASQSQHTEKVPTEDPSSAEVLLNATEI